LHTRARTEALSLIPAGLTVAVVVAWTATGGGYEARPVLDGGYNPNPWYLGALFLVGLCCATVLGIGRVRVSRWAAIAWAALAAYTSWSFLSVLWAHDQGAAFLGSDRALVYLAAFTTFVILPWSAWSARVALSALVAGLGGLALLTAIRLAVLADPSSLYLNARLVYPLGYYNADAALFTMTALVAIALCSRRGGSPPLRVAGLVLAAVCLQLAVLGQSRGWLFTAPLVLALALLIVPGRLRLLVFALGPVAAAALAAPALLQVYDRATAAGATLAGARLAHVLHQQGAHAARAMLLADAVLALLAALAVGIDRRVQPTGATKRRVDRLAAALLAVAALAGVLAALLATHGHVVARVEHAWRSFANTGNAAGAGSSRFTALGSQRVDFWRVALHEWSAHPLLGVGQDNFAAAYIRLRHTTQEPRWAHSLELRLLVHTGLVGALLFALFILAVAIAALRRGRATPPSERVAAGIALLPLVVWLVHGSIDWFWEMPALSVAALAFAGAATALGNGGRVGTGADPAARSPTCHWRRWEGAPLWCATALLGGGALLALGISFVAAREVQRSIAVWPRRPALAYSELRSASGLLPFDAQIYLVGGAVGLKLAEAGTARHWLEQAERRDDEEWVAPFLLGLLDGEQGRRAQARVALRRALRLNPREPVIGEALARSGGRHPLTVEEAQLLLSSRAQARFGR
jgi:tetratricopeptide (TPR) repeat protein